MQQVSYEQQSVSFDKNNTNWPLLGNQPVPLIPDSVPAKQTTSSEYLLPIFKVVTDNDNKTEYKEGYLRVVADDNNVYTVVGFQDSSSVISPGKTSKINVDDEFRLAAYVSVVVPAGSPPRWEFWRTTNSFTVSALPVTLSFGAVTGNEFAFVVNDLTGAISVSNNVAY